MNDAVTGAPRRRLLFVAANPSIDRLYELDRLTTGAIHRPLSMVAVAGGKGLNAARVAASLGGSVTAAGIVAGRAGEWIVEQLVELGIEARMDRSTGETRTCVSILDRSTGDLTELYERGVEIAAGSWDALEAAIRTELETGGVAVLTCSGSLPPGAPADGFARIARVAAACSPAVPVLADTYGPALSALLAAGPAVLKLNATEAAEASGVDVSDAASALVAADVLRDAGAGNVIVTVGLWGAVVLTGDRRIHLRPPDLRGDYPVGSGDAFLGGLAVAYGRGDDLIDAARLGLAAAVANALVPGAGRLDPTVVHAIVERIEPISI